MQEALPSRGRVDEPSFSAGYGALGPDVLRLEEVIDGVIEFRLVRDPTAGTLIGPFQSPTYAGDLRFFASTAQPTAPALGLFYVDDGERLHFLHIELAD